MILLGRAKKHLDRAYATKDGGKRYYSLVEAAILAAAAIECEVNWTLFKPLLLMEDKRIQQYHNLLTMSFAHSRIHEKICFLLTSYPSLVVDKTQNRLIKRLFDLRNMHVHATPKLIEPHYIPDNWDRWGENIALSDLPKRASLTSKVDSEAIDDMPVFIAAARKFIKRLRALSPIGLLGKKRSSKNRPQRNRKPQRALHAP